jgi:hypothetical protein
VAIPDIFAFLSAYFAGLPSANVDGVSTVNAGDVRYFLTLWCSGCP